MPFGAPILWPERVSRVASAASRDDGQLPERLHGVGVEHARRRRGSARPISSTGCIVPTSLFTHMTDTTAGCGREGRSSAARSTTPRRSTGRMDSAPPSRATACAAARTALCSVAQAAACIGRPAAPAASAAPMTARLSASVPPEVKITWFGSAPTAAATLRRASSTPARAVRPKRCALDGLPKAAGAQEGQHRLEHLGAHGRRGGVVEIDRGVGHGGQDTYMLETSSASTSSIRTVSWVK